MNRKEALLEIAQQRGINVSLAKAVLEDVDRDAIRQLLEQVALEEDSHYLIPQFIAEIMNAAMTNNRLLEVADLLLEKPNYSLPFLARHLSNYHNEKAVSMLRQIMTLSWASDDLYECGALALLESAYHGDCALALQDESVLVRRVAVKQLEAKKNTPILIAALSNDVTVVRRVVAWYMGRNKVYEATDILLQRLSVEQDIEALRAVIWSLGVLNVTTAYRHIEILTEHSDPLIRRAAQDALTSLN